MTTSSNGHLLLEIERAIKGGRFQRADLAIRALLEEDPSAIAPKLLLADLAAELGRWHIHAEARESASRLGAKLSGVDQKARQNVTKDGHLLIPEWGHGFWSDVAHVMGSLLLAEMTGRTPTVYWSDASLFSPEDGNNAWDRYFEPVGPPRELLPRSDSYFPAPWNYALSQSDNLCQVRQQRPANSYGIGLLSRSEGVVVSDTFVAVSDLWPWLEPKDFCFGASLLATKRHLAKKHLQVRPHFSALVESIWSQNMAGRRWLAVHIRGSDKSVELDNLEAVNAQYPPIIDQWLAQGEGRAVFLLTDSIPQYIEMRRRYGKQMIALNTIRTQTNIGVHLAGNNPVQIGEQVLVDALLAAKCDEFLGNGTSNVSLAVEFLKDWQEGTYRLVGPDWRRSRFTL